MTRKEVLRLAIAQARRNGFQFGRWFRARIQPGWTGIEDALDTLASGQRHYALLFCHQFARSFWKEGSQISFLVPSVQYTRRDKHGNPVTITRKAFTRRTLKADVWRYHLREMAVSEDPLAYLRRFLVTREDLEARAHSSSAR